MKASLSDRLFWLFNKKPSKKYNPYSSVLMVGFTSGCLVVFGFLIIMGASSYSRLFGLIPIAMGTGNLFWSYYEDKKKGYVDAYYGNYLKRREEIGKKLGKL